jgi:hypothetical protein
MAFISYILFCICSAGTYFAWDSVAQTEGWLKLIMIVASVLNPSIAIYQLVDGIKEQLKH